jgi:hypothetical protein
MNFQNKRLIGIVFAVALLLLIPLIAGFPWSVFDFIVAGILLLGTGLACEFALRTVTKTGPRIVVIVIILILLFLIWAELAVGIFGTPFAGN